MTSRKKPRKLTSDPHNGLSAVNAEAFLKSTPVADVSVLVEYARFIEVQQRRARIIEELTGPKAAETPEAGTATASVDAVTSFVESGAAPGTGDVR